MILMALYQRERTGEGQSIEMPMFENMAKSVLEEHMYLKTFEPPLGPTGDPRLLDPAARPLPTSDGYICISANTNASGVRDLRCDRQARAENRSALQQRRGALQEHVASISASAPKG